jgi:hypothetical protein
MWIVIPTDTPWPLGTDFLEPDTWVAPIQYDSPDDFIRDYLANEPHIPFNKDFEVWIFNIATGQSISFWQLLSSYQDSQYQAQDTAKTGTPPCYYLHLLP